MIPAILIVAAVIAAVVITALALGDSLTSSREAADCNFPNTPVGATQQSCPLQKTLKGKVVEVTWGGAIKVSRASGLTRATVPTPHWVEGAAVADGAGSLRPGVILIGSRKGTGDTKARVEITENVNVSGNGIVRGTLGTLEFEGSCPTAMGVHDVALVFKRDPDAIAHLQGDASWGIDVPDMGGTVALANDTRLEVFVVIDTPAALYEPHGVWVEALRFMCDTVGVTGLRTPGDVASRTATYCHGSHGLVYDTFHGRPNYGCSGAGGTFKLKAYLAVAQTVVNCYDQAGGMQTLCGATGTLLEWNYLEPFGYINSTALVGVGTCNSPFYSSNGTTPVMPRDDPRRTAFGNHAFGRLSGMVLDACAGPHTGAEPPAQYCTASIDSATTLYATLNRRPGTAADIKSLGGVSQVV